MCDAATRDRRIRSSGVRLPPNYHHHVERNRGGRANRHASGLGGRSTLPSEIDPAISAEGRLLGVASGLRRPVLCCQREKRVTHDAQPCTGELYRCALGFLYSYIALIHFESDLTIAHGHRLLPTSVRWPQRQQLVQQLLANGAGIPPKNSRYLFSELRLSQLNQVYAFRELFRDYLTLLTGVTIYVALVLAAMQVGLATTCLSESISFQNASSGCTVFAILGTLVAACWKRLK
ncbi:uncharacterized protein N7459_003754 [Penicillium hispanicum]|uniref:uncharacterized protein n=1 Tax=Penicillium hispanicum TaxID=1080232 RepID=UPI00253F7FBC|nr:uncharacterized protein N7459_003754 [Penicillium hispanicum]KAJ5587989.1 hypothetical protein N7459_003754 [Penicillium hispanicum]